MLSAGRVKRVTVWRSACMLVLEFKCKVQILKKIKVFVGISRWAMKLSVL